MEEIFKIDKTDVKIIRTLLSNARFSLRQIAREVGVSVATVLSRIKRMEREGVIKGYSALVDLEKLGYDLTAIIEVTVSKGRLLEVEREIAKMKNVCAVYDITGLTDALIIAKFKRRQELSEFVKKILAMPFVERTNTHLVLTTIKEDFRLV